MTLRVSRDWLSSEESDEEIEWVVVVMSLHNNYHERGHDLIL